MSATDWIVLLAGAAAIAWVNWYFFLAERSAVTVGGPASATVAATAAGTTTGATEVPEVKIVVRGGYSPAAIRVQAGRPVRLVFDRQDTSSCSEEIVIPDFGVRRFLPTGKPVAIELTPPKPGRYEFQCGMGMLHGALIAEEAQS
jgi:plastocyanin domain-containing protein